MHWRSYTATIVAISSLTVASGCDSKTALSDTAAPASVVAAPVPAAAAPGPTVAEVSTAPAAAEPAAAPSQSYFREGVNRATSAVNIGKSAQSPDDWQLAASRWQQALSLMQKVPASDPNHATAQAKIKEYQQNLTSAQQRVQGVPQAAASAAASQDNGGLVAQIPIVERRGGTPVVPVTLSGQKGKQQFSMLFDTGATGTLITAEMANALGVVIVGETLATIADGSQVSLPIGYVDAIEAGGLRKEAMLVAIGGDMALLGQDFYGKYGISLGGSSINLYE
ncbi:MAG: clan AA aspartic protease [Cyanobacteria bacterium Co-bin13]|nr:clan AA aspartic protease [Cyanobacteria bacterium Co-bin13]